MSYLQKALFAQGRLRGKAYLVKDLRGSLETLCVNLWRNLKFSSTFSWLRYGNPYLRSTHKNADMEVFQQNWFEFLEKLSKQKWQRKTLPKTNKILKSIFGFDHQAIEHTHITFEDVQSHKWNRHSLNIILVCCVCESSMNLSLV